MLEEILKISVPWGNVIAAGLLAGVIGNMFVGGLFHGLEMKISKILTGKKPHQPNLPKLLGILLPFIALFIGICWSLAFFLLRNSLFFDRNWKNGCFFGLLVWLVGSIPHSLLGMVKEKNILVLVNMMLDSVQYMVAGVVISVVQNGWAF